MKSMKRDPAQKELHRRIRMLRIGVAIELFLTILGFIFALRNSHDERKKA